MDSENILLWKGSHKGQTSFRWGMRKLSAIAYAIGTSLLPNADSQVNTEAELISYLTRAQLNRSYCLESGYGMAHLSFNVGDFTTTVDYTSHSGTNVSVKLDRSEEQRVEEVTIEVHLPESRVGGCHYEGITLYLYSCSFSESEKECTLSQILENLKRYKLPNWVENFRMFKELEADNYLLLDQILVPHGFVRMGDLWVSVYANQIVSIDKSSIVPKLAIQMGYNTHHWWCHVGLTDELDRLYKEAQASAPLVRFSCPEEYEDYDGLEADYIDDEE